MSRYRTYHYRTLFPRLDGRARAVLVSLLLCGWSTGAFAQLLGTPTPTSPANGSTNLPTSATLLWGSVALASSYEVQVSTSATFGNLFADQTQTGTSYSVSGLSQGTTFYWRVRALTMTITGAWSSTWSFSTAPGVSPPSTPTAVSPPNGSSGLSTSVTLTWNGSAGATSYNLQVATDAGFANVVANDSGVGTTSQQVSGLVAGTTYYWRIEAVNSAGTSSWSGAWSFTTASSAPPPSVPTLSSPANGATNQPTTIVVSWNAASSAAHYWLQVATDQVFSNTIVGDSTITSTSEQVNNLVASTVYYWRVRALNGAGMSNWSSVWSFTTTSPQIQPPGTPTLLSPTNGASNIALPVTSTWNAVANADHYFLQIAKDQNFSTIIYANYTIVGTSQQDTGLVPNTTYYWQVKAVNAGGQSNWSTIWSFTTAPQTPLPSVPLLLSPADGATNQPDSLTFKWSSSSAATRYRLQISNVASFINVLFDDSTIGDTTRFVTGLPSGSTLFWRVEAMNTAGSGGWTKKWGFTTATVPTVPSLPILVGPSNGSADLPSTDTLRWNPSRNANSYRVQLSKTSGFASTVFDDSGVVQTYLLASGLETGVTYYWRVEAVNSIGTSGWTGAWSFATAVPAQLPSTPALIAPTNGATNQPFVDTLRWGAALYAGSYQVQISTYPSLDSSIVKDSSTISNFEVVGSLQPLVTYFWRVRAANAAGVSNWSEKWSFTTHAKQSIPLPPSLISPIDGASNLPLSDTLLWSASNGAQAYLVQLSQSSTFDNSSTIMTSDTTCSKFNGLIASGKRYWWRVKAQSEVGESNWSTVWTFSTMQLPGQGPILSTPMDGAVNVPTTVLCSWNPDSSSNVYNLQVAPDSIFDTLIVNDTSIGNTYASVASLSLGKTYYWRVRAGFGSGIWTRFSATWQFTTSSQQVAPGSFAVALEIDYPSSSNTSPLRPSDYRLVGLPGTGSIPIASLLAGTPGKTWEAYWDNGAPSNYLLKFDPTNLDTVFKFALGRAFWIINDGPFIVDTIVPAAPLDSTGGARIPLHSGWNLITDPFPDTISWNAVQQLNGTGDSLYGFTGAFQISTELVPGYGFYFFNSEVLTTLRIPSNGITPSTIATNGNSNLAKDLWDVRVGVRAGGVEDNATWFGVSSGVHHDFNRRDSHKPGGMAKVLSAYFSHPEWDKEYSLYAGEIHPTFNNISQWQLNVDATPFRAATLKFSGVDQVPTGFSVYLYNRLPGVWIDLRKSPWLSFIPVTTTTSFDIVVGTEDALKSRMAVNDPYEWRVGSNYPNPFNLSTIIPVHLAFASHIKIEIFNILGQHVAELFDGSKEPGDYQFVWNAQDSQGRIVPSGVYFCRASLNPGGTGVHKMILLK